MTPNGFTKGNMTSEERLTTSGCSGRLMKHKVETPCSQATFFGLQPCCPTPYCWIYKLTQEVCRQPIEGTQVLSPSS